MSDIDEAVDKAEIEFLSIVQEHRRLRTEAELARLDSDLAMGHWCALRLQQLREKAPSGVASETIKAAYAVATEGESE